MPLAMHHCKKEGLYRCRPTNNNQSDNTTTMDKQFQEPAMNEYGILEGMSALDRIQQLLDVQKQDTEAHARAFRRLATVLNENSNDSRNMFNTIAEQLSTLSDAVHQLQLDVRDIEQRTRTREVQ